MLACVGLPLPLTHNNEIVLHSGPRVKNGSFSGNAYFRPDSLTCMSAQNTWGLSGKRLRLLIKKGPPNRAKPTQNF